MHFHIVFRPSTVKRVVATLHQYSYADVRCVYIGKELVEFCRSGGRLCGQSVFGIVPQSMLVVLCS